MTLSQIKAQIEALCRKYAPQLEFYRLAPVTVKFCDEIHDALTNPQSGPVKDPWDWNRVLLQRMRERRFSPEFRFSPARIIAVHDYLKHCLQKLHVLPQSAEILRILLPESAARGLIPRPIEDPVPLCPIRSQIVDNGNEDPAKNGKPGLRPERPGRTVAKNGLLPRSCSPAPGHWPLATDYRPQSVLRRMRGYG